MTCILKTERVTKQTKILTENIQTGTVCTRFEKICLVLPKMSTDFVSSKVHVITHELKNTKIFYNLIVSITLNVFILKKPNHSDLVYFFVRLTPLNCKICQFRHLTKICLALRQDDGAFEIWCLDKISVHLRMKLMQNIFAK